MINVQVDPRNNKLIQSGIMDKCQEKQIMEEDMETEARLTNLTLSNAHVNPEPPQADSRYSDRENVFVSPHPAMSFHCHNPLLNDLYFYHL